ncbi:MAG: Enamine/imine deaminase [Bacteroidetes bacterium ADurb.Bin408]|nr:MAG: Enamine/imine deaminase [Bacteroidetes bacterium ADurb.Bin408]
MKQIIKTLNSSLPIAPYNQGVMANGTLYISGQIAVNPETATLNNKDVETETHQVMKNIKGILEAAGLDFSNIVKTSIFLDDMTNFGIVNDIYAGYFKDDYPARETVAVKGLPKNVRVEISAIAVK